MKLRITLGFILFVPFILFAQKEANIWYFGQNAGLDFNSGSPVALLDGQLNTLEGCATISDTDGGLLFYTDGKTVYNRNHDIMLNGTGLLGDSSSTHSALIIPKPDTPDVYYIFTVDAYGNDNGLQYSEVDMSLDIGLGGITSNKNVLLFAPTAEKITAVKSSAKNEFWVISHKWESDEFITYNVSNAGVDTTPIISKVGFRIGFFDFSNDQAIGAIKVSPNGKKLAVCRRSLNAQLFDFDDVTGSISNPVTLMDATIDDALYGVEFSPNSNFVYIGIEKASKGIYQFNLSAGSTNDIIASKTEITGIQTGVNGALQLAPDGKIYIARQNEFYLDVINNPNGLGLASNYEHQAISLEGRESLYGLPPFIQSYFVSKIQAENTCFGQSTTFESNISSTFDTILWDFGDGTTSTIENPTHTYASAGVYSVNIIVNSGAFVYNDSIEITIYEQPIANTPPDIKQCDSDTDGITLFDLTTQNNSILNGQSSSEFEVIYFASQNDYLLNTPIPTPDAYTNEDAYSSQEIIASLRNRNNIECNSNAAFKIETYELPTPLQSIPDVSICDNTTVGTDTDGLVITDLTLNEAIILNGQAIADFSISYYTDSGFLNIINNPQNYQNTEASETIYVKVTNRLYPTCAVTTQFDNTILSLPTITPTVALKQCDDDVDGFSVFNLNEVINKISTNAINEAVTFHESSVDATTNNLPIANLSNYANQVVNNDTIWARVENLEGCYRVSEIQLIVSTTQIPISFTKDFYSCDDIIGGSDGVSSFDFSSVTNEILAIFPIGQQIKVTYYSNLQEALSEENPIADISNYRNEGYPTTHNVYIRVDSSVNNDCIGLGDHITLHVETVPIAHPVSIPDQCDDDGDSLFDFDTSSIESTLLNGQLDTSILYWDENGTLLSSPLPNPFKTANQTITARLINTNSVNSAGSCYDETTITFTVEAQAVAYPINDIIVCDDDQDGIYAFDTTSIESNVLNGQIGMKVSYYDQSGALLPSPLPNPFITSSQFVTARVENPLGATCFSETSFELVVVVQPVLEMKNTWTICENDTVQIIADIGYDEYIWSTGEITSTIMIDTPGEYELEVANAYDSVRCVATKTITVLESTIATITEIETLDWTQSNNAIKINVTGTGDYEYSIDGVTFQNSNEFNNLIADEYLIHVRDKNGCGMVTKEVFLLFFPSYFTPNGDSVHDTWQISNGNTEPTNRIFIYDRYGKLLKQLNPTEIGWNGTYKGRLMPSGEYWFKIQRSKGSTYTGHFSLIR